MIGPFSTAKEIDVTHLLELVSNVIYIINDYSFR